MNSTNSLATKSPRKRTKNLFPYLVLTPMMVWVAVFVVYPAAFAIWTSMHLWIIEEPLASPFVGLQNYINLVQLDPRFPVAVKNTLIYGAFVTLVVVPLGFLLAYILWKATKLKNLYTFAYFMPYLMPPAIVGILFSFFYQPAFGTANFVLGLAGIPRLGFLRDPQMAIWTVGTVEIWLRMGFAVLILYSGMISLPIVMVEAARIDGANELQILWKIITPLMTRVLVFVSAVTMITALQTFDLIYVMTSSSGSGGSPGGPGISTYTMSLLVYNEGLMRFKLGTASAVSVLLFILVFLGTWLQLRYMRQDWEYYQ